MKTKAVLKRSVKTLLFIIFILILTAFTSAKEGRVQVGAESFLSIADIKLGGSKRSAFGVLIKKGYFPDGWNEEGETGVSEGEYYSAYQYVKEDGIFEGFPVSSSVILSFDEYDRLAEFRVSVREDTLEVAKIIKNSASAFEDIKEYRIGFINEVGEKCLIRRGYKRISDAQSDGRGADLYIKYANKAGDVCTLGVYNLLGERMDIKLSYNSSRYIKTMNIVNGLRYGMYGY